MLLPSLLGSSVLLLVALISFCDSTFCNKAAQSYLYHPCPEENTLPFIDISVDCNSDGTVHVAWERSTSGLDLDVTNVDIVYACYNGSLSQEILPETKIQSESDSSFKGRSTLSNLTLEESVYCVFYGCLILDRNYCVKNNTGSRTCSYKDDLEEFDDTTSLSTSLDSTSLYSTALLYPTIISDSTVSTVNPVISFLSVNSLESSLNAMETSITVMTTADKSFLSSSSPSYYSVLSSSTSSSSIVQLTSYTLNSTGKPQPVPGGEPLNTTSIVLLAVVFSVLLVVFSSVFVIGGAYMCNSRRGRYFRKKQELYAFDTAIVGGKSQIAFYFDSNPGSLLTIFEDLTNNFEEIIVSKIVPVNDPVKDNEVTIIQPSNYDKKVTLVNNARNNDDILKTNRDYIQVDGTVNQCNNDSITINRCTNNGDYIQHDRTTYTTGDYIQHNATTVNHCTTGDYIQHTNTTVNQGTTGDYIQHDRTTYTTGDYIQHNATTVNHCTTGDYIQHDRTTVNQCTTGDYIQDDDTPVNQCSNGDYIQHNDTIVHQCTTGDYIQHTEITINQCTTGDYIQHNDTIVVNQDTTEDYIHTTVNQCTTEDYDRTTSNQCTTGDYIQHNDTTVNQCTTGDYIQHDRSTSNQCTTGDYIQHADISNTMLCEFNPITEWSCYDGAELSHSSTLESFKLNEYNTSSIIDDDGYITDSSLHWTSTNDNKLFNDNSSGGYIQYTENIQRDVHMATATAF